MQGQALPGFRDFYPEDFAFRNSIFATWREVARRYGFQEYDGPPLEPLELYTDKSGAEIVQQLYAFEDKGGRQNRNETERRLREAQFDASAIERLFEIASLKGIEAVLAELRRCPDGPAAGESLVAVITALGAMGLSEFVEVDLTVVRGLAYYTGTVFELFDRAKELRAICGGGRYDNLIKEIAGMDLPCVGFGMGDVVLGELLTEHRRRFEAPGQLDAFLVAVGGEDVAPVLHLAAGLRDRGIAVEYALRNQPIRKQLELAAARGAPRAVIIGPDERKAKVAVVRDLKTGKQRKVALTKVRKGVFK